jgi:hypothetical protein
MGLGLFIDPDAGDPSRIKLLDLTPGALRMEYGGAHVEEALGDFDRNNSEPKGLIKLQIPANGKGIQPLSRQFQTNGASVWGGLSSTPRKQFDEGQIGYSRTLDKRADIRQMGELLTNGQVFDFNLKATMRNRQRFLKLYQFFKIVQQ